MKKNKLFVLFLFPLGILLLQSCGKKIIVDDNNNEKFCMTDSLYKSVTIDTVKTESVTNELTLSGRISVNEDNMVKIFPLASGHVSDVKVTLGDFVKEGQVLAVIRSSDMANFNNEFNSSQSELAIAKKNLDATEDMYKSGLRSQVELITAQKEYQKAQSQLTKITEVLKIYGSAKEEGGAGSSYIIKSPISGFIVEKNINTGMELRPDDGTSLFIISDLKEVWAVANLYESDIAKVQPGYHAEVSTISYGDKIFPGKVDKVGNVLNPETKVLNLKIRLENPEYLLKPGMFARILLRYPENKKMLVVPSASVVFDDNKYYVVLFKDKCNVSMQLVGVYKTLDNRTFIQDGIIKEKDMILTKNGLYVFTALKKQ